jgi:hypothetical protein
MLKVPHVIREIPFTKNCKMLYIIGIIVIGFLLIFTYYNNNQLSSFQPDSKPAEQVKLRSDSIVDMNYPTTIKASHIILSNLNKFNIPVKRVSIIDNNKKLIYLNPSKISYNKGIMIHFSLPSDIQISQIIIDNNILSKYTNNITTTQITVRDAADKIVWTNNKPLPGGIRYIYLPITTQKIIHPDKYYLPLDDCKEFGECTLKKILNPQFD